MSREIINGQFQQFNNDTEPRRWERNQRHSTIDRNIEKSGSNQRQEKAGEEGFSR